MSNGIEIRRSLPMDITSLEKLYPEVFPDEDLLPLVRELLIEEAGVLSLVAISDRTLAGHVVFTMCSIAGRADEAALLGPLAVAPTLQRRGIGGALIREGLQLLRTDGATQVHVLGDPGYYGRFGFESDDCVVPPYRLPDEWRDAWQSIRLRDSGPPLQGALSVPKPWQQPSLWAS